MVAREQETAAMNESARHPSNNGTSKPVTVNPHGRALTRDDLPPPGTKRWVIRRKAEVVSGVRGGLITLEEALERYNLSAEEFQAWERQLDRHGVNGLRATLRRERRTASSTADDADTVAPLPQSTLSER